MSHVVFMDLPLCQSLPFVIFGLFIFKVIFYSSILFIPVLTSFGFLHVVILLVLGVTSDFRVVSLTFCCYVRETLGPIYIFTLACSRPVPVEHESGLQWQIQVSFLSLQWGPTQCCLRGWSQLLTQAASRGSAECRVLGVLWPGPLAERRGISWALGLPCRVPLAALPAQEESGLGELLRLHRKQSAPRLEPMVAEFPGSWVWAGRGP